MTTFPNAKINIGLQITNKRGDGFHNICTYFYPIPLFDVLDVIKNNDSKTNLFLYGRDLDGNIHDNLCVKAYNLLAKDYDIPNVNIYLYKNIPAGAGMGGGSADATFTLKSLNKIFNLNLSVNQLKDYAEKLGSDCPFFVESVPSIGTSKGEVLAPLKRDLTKYIVIVIPSFSISTKEAYSNVTPNSNVPNLQDLVKQPIESWKNNIVNDFEDFMFQKYPSTLDIKNKLYSLGAKYASLTGSGSAFYGLFDKKIDLNVFNDEKENGIILESFLLQL